MTVDQKLTFWQKRLESEKTETGQEIVAAHVAVYSEVIDRRAKR